MGKKLKRKLSKTLIKTFQEINILQYTNTIMTTQAFLISNQSYYNSPL